VRTREALRRGLLQLLTRKSWDQMTIRDICKVANVGYTTYFRHHPSLASLLDEVAAEQIGSLIRLVMPLADSADLAAASLALFSYVDKHRKLWSTLLTGGAEGALRAEFMRLARQLAATRSRPGIWPPPDIATMLVVSSTIELLSWWLRQQQPLTIQEIAEIHERVIITPTIYARRRKAGAVRRPGRSR
jgi:AcrR family transcriptional regulator